MSQAPTQRASRPPQDPPQDPPEDWFEEIERNRAAREREDARLRILSDLQDSARQLGVQAVLPDVNDPLESSDPTPESDLNFPISSAEYWATWRIDHFNDWRFGDYIEE
jgi:hypothetical protein